MGGTKIDVESFDRKMDFVLWRQKMKAILVQQKCHRALGGEKYMPPNLTQMEKEDIMELAYSTIILNLSDSMMRKVRNENTTAKVWLKLEPLYMSQSVPGIAYIKEHLFQF